MPTAAHQQRYNRPLSIVSLTVVVVSDRSNDLAVACGGNSGNAATGKGQGSSSGSGSTGTSTADLPGHPKETAGPALAMARP